MLNLILQRGGAHSETIACFIEFLEHDRYVFYPAINPITGYEQAIRDYYSTEFLKSEAQLYQIVKERDDHGLLIFNTATEINDKWAEPIIANWRGKVVAYNHEAFPVNREGLVQIFAHPFAGRERYILPIANVFERLPLGNAEGRKAQIVIPNWVRPSHLVNKNLALLSKCLGLNRRDLQFILTGMSLDIMNAALQQVANPHDVKVLHQLDVTALSRLLKQRSTYVMPLIKHDGRYASKGLTGSIPLSINHSCPIIVSSEIARAYELESFMDEEHFMSKVPENDESYAARVEQMAAARHRIISRNRERFEVSTTNRA